MSLRPAGDARPIERAISLVNSRPPPLANTATNSSRALDDSTPPARIDERPLKAGKHGPFQRRTRTPTPTASKQIPDLPVARPSYCADSLDRLERLPLQSQRRTLNRKPGDRR